MTVPALPSELETVSLLAPVNVLLRHRYLVMRTSLFAGLMVAVFMLLSPRTYTSESSFMLQSRPSIPSNISGLASQLGLTVPGNDANQSPAFYAELLQSREILSAVVDSPITLVEAGRPRTALLAEWLRVRGATPALQRDKTVRKLGECVSVSSSTKTGVISLKVTTRNAELSQRISQRMLSWLNEFNLQKRQSQASAERIFTEGRLEEARLQLRDSEESLLEFARRNRNIGSPRLRLEQDRLTREVSMRQQVYTSVVQAYDRAKIEEVRNTPVITVLLQPEIAVRPQTRGISVKTLLALILGATVGFAIALWRESTGATGSDGSDDLANFRRYCAEVGEDMRHPLRVLLRIVRPGAADG